MGAQALGQPGGRVVVLPGLAVDDVDPLEPPRRRRAAGVGIGQPGHLLPHVQRLGGPVGPALLGPPGAAADADEAGGAPVTAGRHVRRPVRTAGSDRAA